MTVRSLLLPTLVALALAACNTGDPTATGYDLQQAVLSAVGDVVFDADIELSSGPTCNENKDGAFDCEALADDGQTITATQRGGTIDDLDAAQLQVEKGGDVLYEGTVQNVLARDQ